MKRDFVRLLMIVLLAGSVSADDAIRHFNLQHITAETLIPLISGILDTNEAVTGQGTVLIVRADTRKLTQLETIVRELDRPQVPLLVSVRRGAELVDRGHRLQTDIDYDSAGSENTEVRIGATLQHTTRGQLGEQSLRTVDGGVVAISQGELIALPATGLWGPGVVFKTLERGFAVRVRLVDEEIVLDIHAKNEFAEQGKIQTGAIQTQLRGKLGEWLYLGGKQSIDRESGKSTATIYRTRTGEQESLYIRVDRLE